MLLERHVQKSGFNNKGFRTLLKSGDVDCVFERHKQAGDALKHLFIERLANDSVSYIKVDPIHDLRLLENHLQQRCLEPQYFRPVSLEDSQVKTWINRPFSIRCPHFDDLKERKLLSLVPRTSKSPVSFGIMLHLWPKSAQIPQTNLPQHR